MLSRVAKATIDVEVEKSQKSKCHDLAFAVIDYSMNAILELARNCLNLVFDCLIARGTWKSPSVKGLDSFSYSVIINPRECQAAVHFVNAFPG